MEDKTCVCHALIRRVCHVEDKTCVEDKQDSRSEGRKASRLEPAPQVREQRRWQRKGKRAEARQEPVPSVNKSSAGVL